MDDKKSQFNAVSDVFAELNFDDLNLKIENYEYQKKDLNQIRTNNSVLNSFIKNENAAKFNNIKNFEASNFN